MERERSSSPKALRPVCTAAFVWSAPQARTRFQYGPDHKQKPSTKTNNPDIPARPLIFCVGASRCPSQNRRSPRTSGKPRGKQ
eukprot:3920726-Pyramimonas_sp.AAC.1